jgi:hypothetical protein
MFRFRSIKSPTCSGSRSAAYGWAPDRAVVARATAAPAIPGTDLAASTTGWMYEVMVFPWTPASIASLLNMRPARRRHRDDMSGEA